jgi:hypothetical protein
MPRPAPLHRIEDFVRQKCYERFRLRRIQSSRTSQLLYTRELHEAFLQLCLHFTQYSLFSSVTFLKILTTYFNFGKFYIFQFFKKSFQWKSCNKIFATRIGSKKDRSPISLLRYNFTNNFMAKISRFIFHPAWFPLFLLGNIFNIPL